MTKPLEGILVVALEQAVAAPYCSSRLADAGARVIKIERAEGDFAREYDHEVLGQSAYFVWLNRGKESLVADIKDPEDNALVHRILAKADVFIQNLAPGAAARAGLGSDDLRRRHPRLITVDISGYGDEGPYADMRAYDFLVQGESGMIAVTGTPEHMGRVGASVCDIACGMYARTAVLEALIGRMRTGEGAQIKVSLFGGMAEWLSPPLLHHAYGTLKEQRIGLRHPMIAPYGAYRCQGDDWILIAVQNQREWRRLCTEVLDRPELADDPRLVDNVARLENRAHLDAAIDAVLSAMPREAVKARLAAARIACGAINDIPSVWQHPAMRKVAVNTPEGPIEVVAPPAVFAGAADGLGAVPGLGEHSEKLRSEFST
jgi:itaconate CoA-transferase